MTGANLNVLQCAREVLNGTHDVPQPARVAAVLARQALEDAIIDLCQSAGADLRTATMRSRIASLRILINSDLADRVGVTWSNLSQICHHHAYQLAPTTGEVWHLIEQVDTLLKGGTIRTAGRQSQADSNRRGAN
ncbi:hypothetical protein [Amycolatopsis methanolica]|uniref:hypothetical protein n=1 Tax=Amycolatopsis methanolica TaxID=1814 RepID=UPI003428AE0D